MAVHILLYVPNVIGYVRVGLLVAFYVYALREWEVAIGCYLLSFLGDLFDGFFAKQLAQTSTFGMILDMVTDRVATAGLLTILAVLYPPWAPVFAASQGLDLASHWFHMYSTATGGGGGHHKSDGALKRRNFILRTYYKSYPLFAYLCVSAELTYVALYVLKFRPDFKFFHVVHLFYLYLFLCLPGCIVKQVVNLAQLASAVNDLVQRDIQLQVHQSRAAAAREEKGVPGKQQRTDDNNVVDDDRKAK
mmetsp:Transcript_258/g.955  ORF Transcript_258/g.955 Transcript_258/m.955 type:complete len:248 (-) Transcript_258:111-854(-)